MYAVAKIFNNTNAHHLFYMNTVQPGSQHYDTRTCFHQTTDRQEEFWEMSYILDVCKKEVMYVSV